MRKKKKVRRGLKKKAAKKRVLKKKKKAPVRRRNLKAGKKRVAKKKGKAVRAKKKTSRPRKTKIVSAFQTIPEGASLTEAGRVTHYFPHVQAAVVKMTNGTLSIGDEIIIKGHTTDFRQQVDSIQLNHAPINTATPGQEIGLRVKDKVREHDLVYKIVKP